MLFRKKLFKRSSQYLPHQQTDEFSTPKMGKPKKSKVPDKTVQVLKMCHTVKGSGGCIGQRVFHGPQLQQRTYDVICADPKTKPVRITESRPEICALKKAKLACLERNNASLPKSCTQIYNERRIRSQNIKNVQHDHPAFRSSLFTGSSKKENRNERNRRFGEFKLIKSVLPTLQEECEDEHHEEP